MRKPLNRYQWSDLRVVTCVLDVYEEDVKELLGEDSIEEALSRWESFSKEERLEIIRGGHHLLSAVDTYTETEESVVDLEECDRGEERFLPKVTKF